LHNKAGLCAVKGTVFVDSTGAGDLAANASTIGERESRRVPGHYYLATDDFFAARKFIAQIDGKEVRKRGWESGEFVKNQDGNSSRRTTQRRTVPQIRRRFGR